MVVYQYVGPDDSYSRKLRHLTRLSFCGAEMRSGRDGTNCNAEATCDSSEFCFQVDSKAIPNESADLAAGWYQAGKDKCEGRRRAS